VRVVNVKGKPLRPWLLGLKAGIVSSGIAALLAYISLALVVAGLKLWSLFTWVLSGFFAGYTAFISSYYSFNLISSLASLLNARESFIEIRPLADPYASLAYSIVAPPAAAAIMLFNSRWIIDTVYNILEAAGGSGDGFLKWLIERGLANENGVKSSTYLVGLTVLGLPHTVARHFRWLLVVTCAAIRNSPPSSVLWDKPCTQDFIEVMVWGELNNSTLNSKLFAEKWSIQD
jgi:hypothetical protein